MEKRKVTPEEVVETMKKEVETFTIEQAQKVLDFMYKMAEITLSILLDEKKLGMFKKMQRSFVFLFHIEPIIL